MSEVASQLRIGIVGAGTMGGGIAQVAALAGHRVVVYDVSAEMLDTARRRMVVAIRREAEAGQLSPTAAERISEAVLYTGSLAGLAEAEVVIEAAPEDVRLKSELFGQLDQIVSPNAILASNTSTLSITELAGGTARPERVAGMHFFNPAPRMRLVEVVRGERTSEQTVECLCDLATAWGKTAVVAADSPGFIVNRIARPFYLEALRIVGEGVATPEQVDRIAVGEGGFRMGPFELMDLIGIDVNYAASLSVYEAFFHEPRFRPHPIQRRMVAGQRLGRKTRRGFYAYDEHGRRLESARAASLPNGAPPRGAIALIGNGALADELRQLITAAGLTLVEPSELARASLVVDATPDTDRDELLGHLVDCEPSLTVLVCCHAAAVTPLAQVCGGRHRLVGYAAQVPLTGRSVVELALPLHVQQSGLAEAVGFWRAVGREPEVVRDAAGLVMPRIVASLINEACYALSEGVADQATIDTAMRLGTNYPLGPFEWADVIGLRNVRTTLQGLVSSYGERNRSAPLLELCASSDEWPSESVLSQADVRLAAAKTLAEGPPSRCGSERGRHALG